MKKAQSLRITNWSSKFTNFLTFVPFVTWCLCSCLLDAPILRYFVPSPNMRDHTYDSAGLFVKKKSNYSDGTLTIPGRVQGWRVLCFSGT